MLKALRSIIKDKRGLSVTIEMLFSVIFLVILLLIVLETFAASNRYAMLESFGDELSKVVGEAGQCSNIKIDRAIESLCDSYGFTPEIQITADQYFDSVRKKVQRGDPIYIKLTLQMGMFGFFDYRLPFTRPFTVEKVTQSEQYWK